jgi:hypothetical protein
MSLVSLDGVLKNINAEAPRNLLWGLPLGDFLSTLEPLITIYFFMVLPPAYSLTNGSADFVVTSFFKLKF